MFVIIRRWIGFVSLQVRWKTRQLSWLPLSTDSKFRSKWGRTKIFFPEWKTSIRGLDSVSVSVSLCCIIGIWPRGMSRGELPLRTFFSWFCLPGRKERKEDFRDWLPADFGGVLSNFCGMTCSRWSIMRCLSDGVSSESPLSSLPPFCSLMMTAGRRWPSWLFRRPSFSVSRSSIWITSPRLAVITSTWLGSPSSSFDKSGSSEIYVKNLNFSKK